MQISGEWLECDDGIIRPIIPGFVQASDGRRVEVTFLLDGGADRTVLSARYLNLLRPLERKDIAPIGLAGIGGSAGFITVETVIGFKRTDNRDIIIRGPFNIFTEFESSDLSILGRDVTNNFAVIYDYPSEVVTMLARPHFYEIKNRA